MVHETHSEPHRPAESLCTPHLSRYRLAVSVAWAACDLGQLLCWRACALEPRSVQRVVLYTSTLASASVTVTVTVRGNKMVTTKGGSLRASHFGIRAYRLVDPFLNHSFSWTSKAKRKGQGGRPRPQGGRGKVIRKGVGELQTSSTTYGTLGSLGRIYFKFTALIPSNK